MLLDALDALADQRDSLILVGAQAVYLRTGPDESSGVVNTTTDADLALDADLLSDDPELTQVLETAGFSSGHNPGSWIGAGGVAIDIMVALHQRGAARAGARGARLPPHGNWLARITPGLEATLVDHSPMFLEALDPSDARTTALKVAGPAALLVAKAYKILERAADIDSGRGRSRLRNKDAVDILRLLRGTETGDMAAGFTLHAVEEHARDVRRRGLGFLAEQRTRGEDDVVHSLIAGQLGLVAAASYHALLDELLEHR